MGQVPPSKREAVLITTERSIDVDASADRVWAVLGRFMHIDEFHPWVSKVEVLSKETAGVGACRRCHFKDGSSLVEKVVEWQEGRFYRVELSESALPFNEAVTRFGVEPLGPARSRVTLRMRYQVKYGPIGWLMGKTVMERRMGDLFLAVLRGLQERVTGGSAPAAT